MPLEISERDAHSLILYQKPKGDAAGLTGKEPLPLLSVGNRFLVEHQLEWLSDQGFKDITLSHEDRSGSTEQEVAGGARWLTRANHIMDPMNQPFKARLHKALCNLDCGVLIMDGQALIRFDFPMECKQSLCFSHEGQLLPIVYCAREDLKSLLNASMGHFEELCAWLQANAAHCQTLDVAAFYHRIDTLENYLALNRLIMDQAGVLSFKGSLSENNVRHGRRLRTAKTTALKGPALIGDEVYICSKVEIGPNAIIGDRSYIDEGASIVDSVVAPDTYVGPNTFFKNKYVCRNYVLDLSEKTSVFIDDPVILADLTRRRSLLRRFQPLLAAMLLLKTLPFLLLLLPIHRILKGQWVSKELILKQPVKRNLKNEFDYQWVPWLRFEFGFFILDLLPSLWNIATGSLNFVGNPPLRKQDLADIDPMWRGDRLRGYAGFTGLVQQLDGSETSSEEVFATVIYYNATRTIKGDLRLFVKALLTGKHRHT